MEFFRVVTDPSAGDAWFPDEPFTSDNLQLDAREFTLGRPYAGAAPHRLRLAKPGRATGFTLAAFDMPIVSRELGLAMNELSPLEIQRLPITVDGYGEGWEILNVTSVVPCLDENHSVIQRWTRQDARPEKVGTYRMVTNLTIDASRATGKDIFRVAGWEIALVVSGRVKRAIEVLPGLAIAFRLVGETM
jgi:hypothetical protein